MRELYIKDLESFSNKLAEQAAAVNEQVHKSIKAFNDVDGNIAQVLEQEDKQINQLANDIEKEAYRLIALQQPVAEDLRLIFSVLNISVDLERIGDHAVLIAKNISRAEENADKVEALAKIINNMADVAVEMLGEVMDAFSSRDQERAIQISEKDEIIDAGLKELYHQSSARMETDTEIIGSGINYLGVGNSIERIGDYVTNICERIVYLNEAEIVELNQ